MAIKHRPLPLDPKPNIPNLLLLAGDARDEAVEPWRSSPAPSPEHGAAAAGRHILVAEDDAMVRLVIERLLAEQGHLVRTASHGGEALELALAGPVDLLVTDVRMPGLDGWELSRALRERWPDLPVVFISGFDVELTRSTGPREPGVFLRKPFDPDELVRRVTQLLHD
jgi:two-component system cell cycle sensor histidine kinase/response regulator CckA